MAVLTGNSGELRYRGQRIAKCRSFSLDISRDALETTSLGSYDRQYVEGIRGASGSTTVIYDTSDAATSDILNSIFSNDSGGESVDLILSSTAGIGLNFEALITSVSVPVNVGDVIACSVNFQVSGPVEGRF